MKKFLLLAAMLFAGAWNAFSQEKLKAEGEIPILAWIGIPEHEITVERFKEMRDAGFNTNRTGYSWEGIKKALDVGKKTGIKQVISGPEGWPMSDSLKQKVQQVMKHPALAGYFMDDEPKSEQFSALGARVGWIQAIDAKHYCYVNLLPNTGMGDPGQDGYPAHLEAFLKEVPVPFISFDCYPVRADIVIRPQWYRNLEDIRDASLKTNKPFWAFALSSAHWDYPIPSVAELRLQMFSNLAYGAQGLQYFTYWDGEGNHAPIADGKRTDVYDRVKQVNREIQDLAGVFLNSKVISVWHSGEKIPDRTHRFTPDVLPPVIKRLETGIDEIEHAARGGAAMATHAPLDASKDSENNRYLVSGAVISLLEKKDKRFLVIVNRDYRKPMWLDIDTDKSVKKVLKDGTVVPASTYSNRLVVDPGDVVIYMWEEKPVKN